MHQKSHGVQIGESVWTLIRILEHYVCILNASLPVWRRGVIVYEVNMVLWAWFGESFIWHKKHIGKE